LDKFYEQEVENEVKTKAQQFQVQFKYKHPNGEGYNTCEQYKQIQARMLKESQVKL
jgi:hypothetical protein